MIGSKQQEMDRRTSQFTRQLSYVPPDKMSLQFVNRVFQGTTSQNILKKLVVLKQFFNVKDSLILLESSFVKITHHFQPSTREELYQILDGKTQNRFVLPKKQIGHQFHCTCPKYKKYILGVTNLPVCSHILALKISQFYNKQKISRLVYGRVLDFINAKRAMMRAIG